ncbi:helix-turn-helix domain-containing protein [Streptomyces sp. NRRL S-241]|uniref:helix-turn-helix domain-containing protein n=1 Tax=Streptomyces sp. NRRL S-241 TaxID=1463896 RepID=UPI00131A781B|nr:helix-turn-helix domain-containing protein [Streptomyces sp. NRRL S-241]
MSQGPTRMSHPPQDRAARRAAVAQLAQTGASQRRIADELGVSKDTVRRDLAAATSPRQRLHERLSQRAALAHDAMRHLRQAVSQATEARPGHCPGIDDDTAAQWHSQLRDDAAALTGPARSRIGRGLLLFVHVRLPALPTDRR